MATFTAGAIITSTANNLLESSLNLSSTRTQVSNKDALYSNLYIGAHSTQSAYVSLDPQNQVAEVAYVYVRSLPNNDPTCIIEVMYQSASANIVIAKLEPGDWMYLPYKSQENKPEASSLKLVNKSAISASYVTVLTAESGSL